MADYSRGTDEKPGPDKAYYETASGIVYSSVFMSNGITGTPPPPAMRGGPFGVGEGTLDSKSPRTGNNGIPGQFFSKGER
jgi:hypothetical protein